MVGQLDTIGLVAAAAALKIGNLNEITNQFIHMENKKLVFIDLDGTLIETASGKTFPEGAWDMRLKLDVFQKLKKLAPKGIFIVTNQGGIEKGLIDPRIFHTKIAYVIGALQEYMGLECVVGGRFCSSNNPENPDRKPNPGMLIDIWNEWELNMKERIPKEEIVMIGDASGLEHSFSDSDKKVAENFGCDYVHVEDFVRAKVRPGEIVLR